MSLAEHRTRLVTSRNRCLVVLLVDIYQKDSSETSLFATQIFRIEIAYLARHNEGLRRKLWRSPNKLCQFSCLWLGLESLGDRPGGAE